MSDDGSLVASRYAEALYELARDKGLQQKVLEDLASVKQALDSDGKAWGTLLHPRLDPSKKQAALAPALAGVDPLVGNTLKLILDKRREACLSSFFATYLDVHEKHEGILHVVVETATEVDAESRDAITERIRTATGHEVRAEYRVNAALLGGMRFLLGSTVVDGSLKGRLARMRTRLLESSLR